MVIDFIANCVTSFLVLNQLNLNKERIVLNLLLDIGTKNFSHPIYQTRNSSWYLYVNVKLLEERTRTYVQRTHNIDNYPLSRPFHLSDLSMPSYYTRRFVSTEFCFLNATN